MSVAKTLSIFLVFVGAAFIISSLRPARKTFKDVPQELKKNWQIIIAPVDRGGLQRRSMP